MIGEKQPIKRVKIGNTRPRWNSEIFYSDRVTRDEKGKKIAETKSMKYLIIPQPERDQPPTRIRDFEFIESYTPTLETQKETTERNKTLFNAERSELNQPLEEIIKSPNAEFTLRTRGYTKSVVIAKRHAEIIIRGKAKFRKIKRVETVPPSYENFKVLDGFSYRFFFNNIHTGKTVRRDIKTNRARKHPTRKIYYPTPTGLKAVKVFLPLNKIVQLTPIKSVIYEIELKPRYKINTNLNSPTPTRTHAKTEISINYKQLARAEKRISKKWFSLLTDSLKDENKIGLLPKHVKKLRSKIVKSKAITPNTLRSQKPITPRRSTVIEYNHALKLQVQESLNLMRARKLRRTK